MPSEIQYIADPFFACRQDKTGAFDKARSQYIVGEEGLRFSL